MKKLAVVLVSGILATGAAWGAACTSPSVSAPLDLTTAGASGFINGAFFQQVPDQSTGTGVIDPFVRLSTNDNCEQGYGTSGRPLPFDENSSLTFTHNLLLSDIPVINLNGTDYLQFLLDINQTGDNPLLSLDQIKIYQSNTADITSTNLGDLGTQVFDLDAAGDAWINLDFSLNSGSGSGDMFAYIPTSLFSNKTYVYFFSRFGEEFNQNDGFEEWALLNTDGSLHIQFVPEPATYLMLGPALLALGFWRRKRSTV
jgi:PEP-CTERM motif-containing protein